MTEINLLKAIRAAEGSDMFALRVEAACWQVGIEYTNEVRRKVALNPVVNATIIVDEFSTVDTDFVTDSDIVAAVRNQVAPPEVPLTPLEPVDEPVPMVPLEPATPIVPEPEPEDQPATLEEPIVDEPTPLPEVTE